MEKTPEKTTSEVKKSEDAKVANTTPSKKTGLIIGIVAGVIALALIIGVIVLCTKKDNSTDGGDGGTSQVEDKEVKTKVVGNDTVGYFTLPEDWVEVTEYVESIDGAAQWGSKDGKYTVGVIVMDTDDIEAKEWAEGVEVTMKDDSDITNVKLVEEDFADFGKAWVVSGNYKALSQDMIAYVFETKDGKTRYLAVQGPDKKNDAFKIVETYKIKK